MAHRAVKKSLHRDHDAVVPVPELLFHGNSHRRVGMIKGIARVEGGFDFIRFRIHHELIVPVHNRGIDAVDDDSPLIEQLFVHPDRPGRFDDEYFASCANALPIHFGAASHVGKVRSQNEDHYAVLRPRRSPPS